MPTTPATKLAAEASDLGMPVGTWYRTIKHADKTFYLRRVEKDREGDVLYVIYTTADNAFTLTVFND